MDLFRCFVMILVGLGACHGAFEDFELSEGGPESLDVKLSSLYGRVGRPVQYTRKVYRNITRIIGGQPTTEPIPYQVSLQVLVHINWKHFCGGSIIGKSHVLTAAHCVDKLRPERISVVAGAMNLKSGGVRHSIVAYKKHPQYSGKGFLINDLAIIKVTPPFQLNQKTIATISLAENSGSRVENNYPVTLTGWGSTSAANQATTPDKLMILHYNTITNSECRKKGYKVTPNEICTYIGKNKGACVVSCDRLSGFMKSFIEGNFSYSSFLLTVAF